MNSDELLQKSGLLVSAPAYFLNYLLVLAGDASGSCGRNPTGLPKARKIGRPGCGSQNDDTFIYSLIAFLVISSSGSDDDARTSTAQI